MRLIDADDAPTIDPFKLVYDIILERFEEEELKAFANPNSGLKEHAVWHKAILILEEYVK